MRRLISSIFAWLVGFVSAVYLLNMPFWTQDLIPDDQPLVGNLDEFGASVLLLCAIQHFLGENPLVFFRRTED